MKEITTIEYTDEDKRLLSIELPDNPCDDCYASRDGTCCGCPTGSEYADKVRPYREAGIYDIAKGIKRKEDLRRKMDAFKQEIDDIVSTLPGFAKNYPSKSGSVSGMFKAASGDK